MLAAGVLAQLAAAVTLHGPAFLIPTLVSSRGLGYAEAGLLAGAPTLGVVLALVPWGIAVDSLGERVALIVGLLGTAVAGAAAVFVHGLVALALALFVAGAFAASTNAASGRLVVGWFPAHRRGLAMGVRQMAQPLGVAVGALTLPVLAHDQGLRAALSVLGVLAAVALVVVVAVVVDPPRGPRPAGGVPSPYRRQPYLPRIHLVSVLLVVPQFTVWTFALVWLVQTREWHPGAAGAVVGAAQILGALGRIAVGHLSDLVGSRMRPLRWVAVSAAVTMALLALTAADGLAVAVLVMVVATGVTVADNGLAFTAVAEYAGPFWSGRALARQNTAQFLAASATAPLAGAVVGAWGFPAAFGLAALLPALAVPLIPRRDEQPSRVAAAGEVTVG